MSNNLCWLISVPGGRDGGNAGKDAAYQKAAGISGGCGSPCMKFDFPTLKVVSSPSLEVEPNVDSTRRRAHWTR